MEASKDDIDPQQLAYLYDRICYFEGRPQKYGTQYDDGGLYPVEDRTALNIYRYNLNLNPIATDKIIGVKETGASQDLHTDPEFNAWRKKVGWIV